MTDNSEALRVQVRIAQELVKRRAREEFKTYVRYMKDDYEMKWFHKYISTKLDEFERGEIKKMMILLPPQHGKSELASRLFPSYLLGKDPNRRVGLVTYNDTFAQKFNRQIQRYMDNEKFIPLFPDSKLNNSKLTGTRADNYARTNHNFDMVDKRGGMITVGRDGQMTGLPIDILIMDDLYKNREEATSPAVGEKVWMDYNDVFKTRLHNDSQQLIMNTRWDEYDLAGRLLESEAGEWEVILFPAIRTEDVRPYDTRETGEALWPEKHSLERINSVKKKAEATFNSLYQQDPKPNLSLLIYPEVVEIPTFPDLPIKYWGLDFGFTTDPTALIKCGCDRDNSYFHECHYEPGTPMKYIAQKLYDNGYKHGEIVYCDHVPTNIEELRRSGIAAFPAFKGAGSIESGIEKMKEFKIHVTASSTNMLMERRRYQWVTYGTIITNQPTDKFNHCWDAARYGHQGYFFNKR